MLGTLKAVLPANWPQVIACIGWVTLEFILPRSRFKANSTLELIANTLKPLLGGVPMVGRLITFLSTYEPTPLVSPLAPPIEGTSK